MSSRSSEHGPLLRNRDLTVFVNEIDAPSGHDASQEQDSDTKSSLYIFMLVLGVGGLQLTWAIELSNGSPYLQSLGISKSLLSLVWIAGPLSGALVQPYVGMRSDLCRSSWGKRKPFIWGGAVTTIVSLTLLAWAREVVAGFCALVRLSGDSKNVADATIVFAVIMVYFLDFAVNTIQAGLRALIVDCAPAHQQERVNAAAGIMTGLGNILAYLAAELDLPTVFWFLGHDQFQILSIIACLALVLTIFLSSTYVTEDDPEVNDNEEGPGGPVDFLRRMCSSVQQMSPQLRMVCLVQFFHWIGWFPFLFYITTYIGQLYVNPIFKRYPELSEEEVEQYWEEGTRVGSFALLIFSVTSFAASVIVPLFVNPPYRKPTVRRQELLYDGPNLSGQVNTESRMSYSPPPPFESQLSQSAYRSDAGSDFEGRLQDSEKRWLTLRRAWLLSQVVFVAAMGSTFFIETTQAGIAMAGMIGISWALTQWAPFALIAAEISKGSDSQHFIETGHDRTPTDHGTRTDDNSIKNKAGIVLGIHNVAITCPQIIAALAGSVIFSFTQKPRGEPGDESTGWVLRFGGLATFAAIYVTYKIRDGAGARSSEQGHV